MANLKQTNKPTNTPEFDPEVEEENPVVEKKDSAEDEVVEDEVVEDAKRGAVSFEGAQAILSTSESETMELGPRPARIPAAKAAAKAAAEATAKAASSPCAAPAAQHFSFCLQQEDSAARLGGG